MRTFKYPWLLLLLTAACKQSAGDLCQENSDCQSGLVCQRAEGTEDRGRCRDPKQIDAGKQQDAAQDLPFKDEDAGRDDDGGAQLDAATHMDGGPGQQPKPDASLDGAVGAEPTPDAGAGMDAG